MAASAVTSAILPASKEDKQQQYSVSLGATNDNPNTTNSCAPTGNPDAGDTCNGPTATISSSGSTEMVLVTHQVMELH